MLGLYGFCPRPPWQDCLRPPLAPTTPAHSVCADDSPLFSAQRALISSRPNSNSQLISSPAPPVCAVHYRPAVYTRAFRHQRKPCGLCFLPPSACLFTPDHAISIGSSRIRPGSKDEYIHLE